MFVPGRPTTRMLGVSIIELIMEVAKPDETTFPSCLIITTPEEQVIAIVIALNPVTGLTGASVSTVLATPVMAVAGSLNAVPRLENVATAFLPARLPFR